MDKTILRQYGEISRGMNRIENNLGEMNEMVYSIQHTLPQVTSSYTLHRSLVDHGQDKGSSIQWGPFYWNRVNYRFSETNSAPPL